MTGCGFNATESASAPGSADITGNLHGGPNPVVGAVVTLYATQSNGYGGAGKVLATTSSSSNGSFTFTGANYTCPTGQQAYITAAGGNTGANTANANSLLMAAIGTCANLNTSTLIWVDELSTVAAAYALSNFITISGTGSTAVVNVSAPANNNAASGSGTCTGTGSAMTCQAAGLAHAFLNAANLVNAVGSISAPPNGQAYATPVSNPTTSATAVALQNVVPQQEINTLGNIVQACVNSTGGAAGSSTPCGTLFTNTTPSSTYSASPITPTNTLQALVNLAKFPFTGTSGLFNLASGSGFYQPTLTAAPPDFSIAIMYRSFGAGANQIGSVYYTTTDINDNVYATALTSTSTGSALGAAPFIASALSSDGVGNWTAPATISTNASNVCSVFAGTAATSAPCEAATDTAGHLYVALGSLNTGFTGGGLFQVSTASGAVTTFTNTTASDAVAPFALAVDKDNNVFYTTAVNGASNLFEMPVGSTASATPTAVASGGAAFSGAHLSDSLVFDSVGNLFAPLASGSNVGYNFFTNSGTVSAEAFSTAANQCNCLGTGTVGDDKWVTGGMVDGSGNYWMTGQYGLIEVSNSATNSTTAAYDAQNATGGGSPGVSQEVLGSTATTTLRTSAMDGASTIFVPDSDTSGAANPSPAPTETQEPTPVLRIYYTTLGQGTSIEGCNTGGATGNTTCITTAAGTPNNQLFYQAINPVVDSTGSMWISSEGNDAVIQVLGIAAPTWPQTSYLHPSVMPQ